MDIQEHFGARLRELRTRAGLTQAELAERCGQGGVEMQRIGELERGERNCTLKTIERLASGLECEPALLFLFSPQAVAESMSLLDSRLIDLWQAANDSTKRKVIRVLSELL